MPEMKLGLQFVIMVYAPYLPLILFQYSSSNFMQTKVAKSMVGVSLAVDSSQSLAVAEYIKQRGT